LSVAGRSDVGSKRDGQANGFTYIFVTA